MTDLTAAAQRALSLMDLTTLNDDDTDAKVTALCHQAKARQARLRLSVFIRVLSR